MKLNVVHMLSAASVTDGYILKSKGNAEGHHAL